MTINSTAQPIETHGKLAGSGVATGWHGWTVSRGPGAKGAPRERDKKGKRRTEEKEKNEKKEKRAQHFSNTRTWAPTRHIPMSLLLDDRKLQN